MKNSRLATTFMMVFVSLKIGVSEIVTKPTVTEVVVGGSTFLNCSTNNREEIHWFHTPFGSNQERNFVYGYDQFYSQYIGRFQMEKIEANGAYNLVIPVVVIDDAGVYDCQDETGRGKKESAELIVLDANPVCEPRLVTDEIIGPNICGIKPSFIISCTVDYNGNEAPMMEWRRVSDNRPVNKGVTYNTIDNKRVVYNLTIDGKYNVKNWDSYFCSTTRPTMSNNRHKFEVKGTGTLEEENNCKPFWIAIICLCLLLLLSLSISVIFCVKLRLRNLRESTDDQEQPPTNGETKEIDPKPTEATLVNEPLLPDHAGESNDGPKSEIETSKSEVSASRNQIRKTDRTINTSINSTVDQLYAEVKDLEECLYPKETIDYAEKPTLVQTIPTDSGNERREPINGMTILDKELFVSYENYKPIEVYCSETFQFIRNWTIDRISTPMDITSCKIANCLYIIFRDDNKSESRILKVEPEKEIKRNWSTGGDHGRLSTYKSNIIVCLFEKQLIKEFSGDGNLIHTVPLSLDVGFNHPWHAIKVTGSHFAVCHGEAKDELHRVCIVDLQGNIIKEIRQGMKQKLNVPICLVEDGERSILVADRENRKVRLLSCVLKRELSLIKKETGLDHYPVRICLDEAKGRLFVAENKKEWKDGRILVFNIR